jgi:hypothetical protein
VGEFVGEDMLPGFRFRGILAPPERHVLTRRIGRDSSLIHGGHVAVDPDIGTTDA